MGMTTAVYLLLAVLVAPALVKLGVPLLAAHMFVFYYGVLSSITPPVAVSAFAAAAIAKCSPNKIGWTACRIGLVSFIVPFPFIYNPSRMLQGSPAIVAWTVVTAIIGVITFSAALEGCLFSRTNILERICLAIGGLALIYPTLVSGIAGFGLLAIGLTSQFLKRRRKVATEKMTTASVQSAK